MINILYEIIISLLSIKFNNDITTNEISDNKCRLLRLSTLIIYLVMILLSFVSIKAK